MTLFLPTVGQRVLNTQPRHLRIYQLQAQPSFLIAILWRQGYSMYILTLEAKEAIPDSWTRAHCLRGIAPTKVLIEQALSSHGGTVKTSIRVTSAC